MQRQDGHWSACFVCGGDGQIGDDETGENFDCDNCGGTGEVWTDYDFSLPDSDSPLEQSLLAELARFPERGR